MIGQHAEATGLNRSPPLVCNTGRVALSSHQHFREQAEGGSQTKLPKVHHYIRCQNRQGNSQETRQHKCCVWWTHQRALNDKYLTKCTDVSVKKSCSMSCSTLYTSVWLKAEGNLLSPPTGSSVPLPPLLFWSDYVNSIEVFDQA